MTRLPVERPGKIVCLGRNWAEHARELGNEVPREPVIFTKPPSSVIAPGQAIVRPVHMSELVHHEGELAAVVGERMSMLSDPAEALRKVRGYTCANDVTARDLQRKDAHFTRAKGFDTFCPLGPHVVTADELGDPQDLEIVVRVNGEVRQRGHTRDMVFPVGAALVHISRIMTLEPGDVVLTGTPAGVGPLVAGDVVSVEISRIGVLENPVVDGRAVGSGGAGGGA